MNEHETEPVRGLPARLPAGEEILWQGAPRWGALARRVFHVRKIAVYFAVLLAWVVYTDVSEGVAPVQIAGSVLWLGGAALVAIGLLCILAWLIARTTAYTITSRRVVMRFGIAFPMTFNLPFRRIRSAGLRRYADGSGDIPLRMHDEDRLAYAVLWPHARPWHYSPAEPMLRGLPAAADTADILARALAADMATRSPAVPPGPAATGAGATGDTASQAAAA